MLKIADLELIPEEERDDDWYSMMEINEKIQDLMETIMGRTIYDFAREERYSMSSHIFDCIKTELETQFGL